MDLRKIKKLIEMLHESDLNVDADDFTNLYVINSPMVGTFYRKPAPDKEPFIQVGQEIKKGDTVCIIEAMKMMNQVKSEFDGTVVSIDIEDGEPVEFNQTLISIERN